MAGTTVAKKQSTGIVGYLSSEAVKSQIVEVVGEKNTPTFISSIVSAVQTNKSLAECTKGSIVSGALLGESLKLTPSPQLGQYYLVPYKNKGTSEAQFQIGYKGYLQLAIRSGQYRKIVVSEVKEGECSGFNPITEEFTLTPILDVKAREKLPVVGYYGMFELTNGFRKEIYWTKEQMESHAKQYSKGYASDLSKGTKYTFWAKDFDSMAKKTLIRQLINKWGVMSVEMQKAYVSDMAVLREDGTQEYIDTPEIEDVVATEIEENANQMEFVDVEATEVTE